MTNAIAVLIGKRIRHIRWATGMTQEELAASADISVEDLQTYETGTVRPRAGRIASLAMAMGVAPADFYRGDRPDPAPDDEAVVAVLNQVVSLHDGGRLADQAREQDVMARAGGMTRDRVIAQMLTAAVWPQPEVVARAE